MIWLCPDCNRIPKTGLATALQENGYEHYAAIFE